MYKKDSYESDRTNSRDKRGGSTDERKNSSRNYPRSRGSKSRTKRNSKQYSDKSQDNSEKTETMRDEYTNDPSWSISDETVAQQSLGWSFSNFIGETVPLNFNGVQDAHNKFVKFDLHVGSIMALELNPSLGRVGLGSGWIGADPKIAAINQQGYKMYSRLSSINSKNTQYGPQDVTTLMLAVGELVSMVSWIQRSLGLTWVYNVRNRTMPKTLIASSGIDPDDLFTHLAQYRIEFNTLIVQANKIPFPSNINYFAKCSQIYSAVYKDSESDMSQMYVFRPFSTWRMDETGTEGTILKTFRIPYAATTNTGGITVVTMSSVLDILRGMINDLMLSATYNYIYADIINYASRSAGNTSMNLLQFATVPENYTVMPSYDPMMLTQINNSTIMGFPQESRVLTPLGNNVFAENTPDNDVVPNETTLCLTYQPMWVHEIPWWCLDKITNFHVDNPDMNMKMEATRLVSGATGAGLIVAPGNANDGKYVSATLVSSDHYIVRAYIYSDEASQGNWDLRSSVLGNLASNATFLIAQFKEAPILYKYSGDATNGYVFNDIINDLDFYTTLSPAVIDRIDTLALYGMFEPKDFTLTRESH